MGCDIHLYVEYIDIKAKKAFMDEGKTPYWRSFGDNLASSRNYSLFGHLTKGEVRSEPMDKGFEPRGLPEDIGWGLREFAYLFISEDGTEEGHTTLEKAKKWGGKIYNNSEGKPVWTDHPDWHSHSWLTTNEYAKVLRNYKADKNNWGGIVEYEAILAAMKHLEKGKDIEARIIFWFDN